MTDIQTVTVRQDTQTITVAPNQQTVTATYGPPGPRGPQGIQGPAGEQGPPGATGPAGATDYNQLANRPDLTAYAARPTLAAAAPLRRDLAATTKSTGIYVSSDSTSNDTTDWPTALLTTIKTRYPDWTFYRRAWDDTTQDYLAPTVEQLGPAGILYTTSTNNAYRAYPATSANIPATVDIRVKLRGTYSTGTWNLAGRLASASRRCYGLAINTGKPIFLYSTNGTGLTPINATTTLPGGADGTDLWIRSVVTWDDGAGNNVAKFYTSTDGNTWTQLGTTVTTAGAITPYNPGPSNTATNGYSLGGPLAGAYVTWKERIYEVQIRDGESGNHLVPVSPDLWTTAGTGTATVTGSPVFSLVLGSKAGGATTYMDDPTRIGKLTMNAGQALAMMASSHNEGADIGSAYLGNIQQWSNDIAQRLPYVPQAFLTQNPERAASVNAVWHAQRRTDLLRWGQAKNVAVIDAFQTFLDYGAAWPTDLMTDDIHPNPAGGQRWADYVITQLGL